MPTNTYVPLGTITLSSTDSEIVFASIPAGYRDLVLVYNGTNTNSAAGVKIRPNGASTDLSWVRMEGQASATSGTDTTIYLYGSTDLTYGIVQFMDYAATDKHKTMLIRDGVTGSAVRASAGRWASTTAITSINLFRDGGGSFSIGTTVSLYGIAG